MKKLLLIIATLFSMSMQGQITYFNSASNPADNGTNGVTPTAVTPPASMVAGDLVIMVGNTRVETNTYAISEAGGQSWNQLANISNTNISAALFWCRYNGAWGANPSVSATTATTFTVTMHVFRPTTGTNIWGVSTAQVELDFVAGTTPFTKTITGQTPNHNETVTFAGWFSPDDNQWGSLSGAGWAVTGLAQYRNVHSTDNSATFAHYLNTTGDPTTNVSKNQSTLGGDAGTTLIVTFYEQAASTYNKKGQFFDFFTQTKSSKQKIGL